MRLFAAQLFLFALLPIAACAQAAAPARVSEAVMQSLRTRAVPPVYSPEAKAAHVSGSVVLRVLIGRNGHVQDATPISGPEMLRFAAADAVCEWEYRPYLLNGKAVDVETSVTVNFRMLTGR